MRHLLFYEFRLSVRNCGINEQFRVEEKCVRHLLLYQLRWSVENFGNNGKFSKEEKICNMSAVCTISQLENLGTINYS